VLRPAWMHVQGHARQGVAFQGIGAAAQRLPPLPIKCSCPTLFFHSWIVMRQSNAVQVLMLRYRFNGWPIEEAGAPSGVDLIFRSWQHSSSVMLDLLYSEKQPTRFSEAMWLRFALTNDVADAAGMLLSKIDALISPSEVVRAIARWLACAFLSGGLKYSHM
jgi:hypothetical protein